MTPGSADVGGIISSVADITVTPTTATWLAGASGANQKGYAYISNNGSNGITLSVSTEAPDLSDTSDNTDGILRYQKYGSTYYRYVGSFRQDGSSNLIAWETETPLGGLNPFYRFNAAAAGHAILTNGTATSATDVDCSTIIPATVSAILLEIVGDGAAGRITVQANGGGTDWLLLAADLGSANAPTAQVIVWLDSSLIFEYLNQNAANVDMYIRGYWDQR